MTIRQQVQYEAQKAAVKIREAARAFTEATGFELSLIDVEYISVRAIEDKHSSVVTGDVTVVAGGVRVSASRRD